LNRLTIDSHHPGGNVGIEPTKGVSVGDLVGRNKHCEPAGLVRSACLPVLRSGPGVCWELEDPVDTDRATGDVRSCVREWSSLSRRVQGVRGGAKARATPPAK